MYCNSFETILSRREGGDCAQPAGLARLDASRRTGDLRCWIALRSRFRLVSPPLVSILALAASCVAEPGTGRITSPLDVCSLSADGALSDDGHPCTINDVCVNRICVGTPVPDGTSCTDGDVCTLGDVCRSALCVGTPAPDGYPCTDDNRCTDPDNCLAGRCQPGPVKSCDDGDPCTVDMCVPATGCASSARECVPPPDALPDLISDLGGEVSLPDGPPADVLGDGPPVDGLDGRVDRGDAAVDAADAGDGGEPDAGDGGEPDVSDGGDDDVAAPHDLRAHGGACNCALGQPAPGGLPLLLAAVAAAWLRRRRRRPR